MNKITLAEHEHVVTAYCAVARGPGFSNTPCWVVIEHGATGKIRIECIQPREQTDIIRAIHPVAWEVHYALVSEIKQMVEIESSQCGKPGNAIGHGQRMKWHAMLDRAMDETEEGDWFLPQFVREVMRDFSNKPTTAEGSKNETKGN